MARMLLLISFSATCAADAVASCDHSRLRSLPQISHPSWCKVLAKCDAVGSALLGTAVNCTTSNTIHKDIIAHRFPGIDPKKLGILRNVSNLDIEAGTLGVHMVDVDVFGVAGGRFAGASEIEKMCKEPICMSAVQQLYDVAISTPEWKRASDFAHWSAFGGIRRRLQPIPASASTAAGIEQLFGNVNSDLMQAVSRLENAAEAQLRICMRDAGVNEATLGLPVSITKMTGTGKFLDVQTLRENACYTMTQWMSTRLSYYSGVTYAEERLQDGSNTGMIIAIVIGSFNLLCCLGGFCGLVVCIRQRTCYFCMKEVSPCCVDCLVECGCGPEDADRLNNEVVMSSSEMNGHESVVKPSEFEMQAPRHA